YAASFAVASLYENVTLWKHIGLDEDVALAALLPMLERNVSVIGSQLDTLAALGEDHMALYAMLTRRVAALARRRS
ncbi:DUF2520 domain-containing protein, partial [Mycetohabitans sp. B6]|nr:DUF2520 domain-containing protein [Mycetohabitans sp. B6]